VDKFGPEKVMVTSFTRAAARKIAAQRSMTTGLPIEVPDSNVGTMHSICYHAFSQPKIMEVNFVKEWNEKYPMWAIAGNKNIHGLDNVADEMHTGSNDGDEMLSRMNIYRNKMIPDAMWPPAVKAFANKWEKFKKNIDAFDFTGLIERALDKMPYAPGQPDVMFVDEAQDFTKLQLELVRGWGIQMKWIVLVGDDDQTIYHFTGADPFAFLLPPVPDDMKTVLKQSYRVPFAVLDRANEIVKRISHREPKQYSARRENSKDPNSKIVYGEVVDADFTYKYPEDIIAEAADHAAAGRSVMILGSCSYMLDQVKKQLKEACVPFGNEYRKTRADWNPLLSRSSGLSAKDLLIAFLSCGPSKPYWSVPQLVNWAQYITTAGEDGMLRVHGKKAIKVLKQAIEDEKPGLHSCESVIKNILKEPAIKPALDRNLNWFFEKLVKSRKDTIEYPLNVYKKYGENIEVLQQQPKITIGTVHSVKGAEADIVYLFPDISWQASKEYDSQLGADAIHRMFYVGMTRAREKLILGSPHATSPYKHAKPYVEL
jgi:superfamily I DNA/RNA helicase